MFIAEFEEGLVLFPVVGVEWDLRRAFSNVLLYMDEKYLISSRCDFSVFE
jgi:hypothetical protein